MFEYQGNRPNQSQSFNRNKSKESSFMREGPYCKLNHKPVKEPPVNSQELHQYDDVADEGVDYSFSNLSVRERKKLFQQNDSSNLTIDPPRNASNPSNNYHNMASHAHETQSDFGDERQWRSKASTWTPRDMFSFANQPKTPISPQFSPTFAREDKRGASVINFRSQASTPAQYRSRTTDTGYNRNDIFRFPNPNNDPMTRSAAFHNPRSEYLTSPLTQTPFNTYHHRNVSGPCTRVIPLTPRTTKNKFDSGYDSYFDKNRISSPHADRYRSQVHIPLANRSRNHSSFDWQNARQSRSQQPLRVNVYNNNDARQESINIPIRPQQMHPHASMSTSVSPQRRLYNDAVYFAYPANSSNSMRPGCFYSDRCNAQLNSMNRRVDHLTNPQHFNKVSYTPLTLPKLSPNSYVVHDPHQSFQRILEPNKNIYHNSHNHQQVTQPIYYKPQKRRSNQNITQINDSNRSGFYRPTTRTNQVSTSVFNPGYQKNSLPINRERTSMPMSQPNVNEDRNFWTFLTPKKTSHSTIHKLQSPMPSTMSNQRSGGAFFDEEAGISEF